VVDGVIVDNSQFLGTNGSRDFANAIADLNSEDIESVSVLKGQTRQHLYGYVQRQALSLLKPKPVKAQKGWV
jgi:hypothetical protein